MATSFSTLATSTPDLTVVTRDEPGFLEAVSSRAFNSRGIPSDANDARLPDAVVAATSVSSVQAAVEYCASNNVKVAVRSGGHSWHTSWLHGKGSIILDVGDMRDVSFDVDTTTATFGPGTIDIQEHIPDNLFYPCGHCYGVPAAGFILGGGFGLAFPRYGMTAMLVTRIQAVLASGQVVEANETSESEKERALFHLLRGSYSGFPGVITSFTAKLLPMPVALMGMFFFPLTEWRRALKIALDIQWKGGDDVSNMETTLSLCHAPPPLAEATDVDMVAMLIVNVWGDSEEKAREIYSKYTNDVQNTLVPPEEPKVVKPVEVTRAISRLYPPKARYASQGFVGDESLYDTSYAEIEALLEPIMNMHLKNSLPPPSHTIVVPVHPRLKQEQHKNQDLAFGFTPSLAVLSYAIYQDESMDSDMELKLKESHESLITHSSFKTEMAEGHVAMTGAHACFTDDAFATVEEQIRLLDPTGVFAGFH